MKLPAHIFFLLAGPSLPSSLGESGAWGKVRKRFPNGEAMQTVSEEELALLGLAFIALVALWAACAVRKTRRRCPKCHKRAVIDGGIDNYGLSFHCSDCGHTWQFPRVR